MRKSVDRFWERLPLRALTRAQWERLCDGCAMCCVHKTREARTGRIGYTAIACDHLNLRTLRCQCYATRRRRVPDCVDLFGKDHRTFRWLPAHCAYRRLSEGLPLPAWHPLLTGRRASTRQAGMSALNRLVHP